MSGDLTGDSSTIYIQAIKNLKEEVSFKLSEYTET